MSDPTDPFENAADLGKILSDGVTQAVEKWLPVVGWEGFYEVSDFGRVRSVDRTVDTENQYGPCTMRRRGRMLKPGKIRTGHLRVSLYRPGERAPRLVHRLVLEAFRGSCPPNHQACHWDDDPTNNRLDNLRWGTRSENRLDSVRNGTHHLARKTHCLHGHEYTPENTYVSQGKRSCKACSRERYIRRRAA